MTEQPRPLLMTADSELLDDLLGLAAAVGVPVDVAVEPAACRPQWTRAPLVLVGADLADALIDARAPARPGVLLVARGTPTDGLEEVATMAGAEEAIGLPSGEAVLLDRLADAAEPAARARVVGVVAGRGGAGASVLAAAIALTGGLLGPRPGWSTWIRWAAVRTSGWAPSCPPAPDGRSSGCSVRSAVALRPAGRAPAGPRRGRGGRRPAGHRSDSGGGPGGANRGRARRRHRGARPSAAPHRRPRRGAHRGSTTCWSSCPQSCVRCWPRGILLHGLAPTRVAPRAVVRPVPGGLPTQEVVHGLQLASAGELPDEAEVRTALLTGTAAGLLRGHALAALCVDLTGAAIPLGVAA